MNRRIVLIAIALLLTILMGCETYTARSAKESIQAPTPVAEGELVTKYSLVEAEEKAKAEAEEAARLAEQERQAEAEERQRYEAMQESIASLQTEKNTLEKKLQESEDALAEEKNNTQSLKESLEERNLLLDNKDLTLSQEAEEYQTTITALQGEIEALHKEIEENEQDYEMLSYQANELENLLVEQQNINNELQTIMHEAQLEHVSEIKSLKAAQEQRLLELQNTIDSLETDTALLTAQLEEKTQTLEERLRLEQQRIDEAKRIEEERLEKQRKKAEEQRKAEEAESARLAALEAEYQQIPPLERLTLPRMYTTDETTILSADNDPLNVLMLPLDDIRWSDPNMKNLVATSISDIKAPVIMVTGHMQNVIDLVRQLRRNAVLVEGGAIITSFNVVSATKHGIRVQFSNTKTIRLSIANLPEYKVLDAFTSGNDWKTMQKQVTGERTKILKEILAEGTTNEPTIIGASLFEPSYQDWSTFSPVPYRQIDYIWPLSNFLEESSFYDVYRATHFSADTDSGNTFVTENLKERIDYIYSRKVLPLQSSMLTIGGESIPDANNIARYGISATLLIP
ncbi:hypothetical protein [Sphaerochaeta sp. S2]|uniref:hypothetical protein n=1 Tax=Sphaerochaeta sp. S2 TaxID=2798868 RepID=UPI0018E9C063|nr:hypothetical protein [Sphaerochaeta sp. S2]MBJ2355333.1 hypothetical protein [Sphaerochaeta sp. S2]